MIPFNKYILGQQNRSEVIKTTSVKSAKPKFKRLDLAELERIYLTDALVRNAINVSVELFDCEYEIDAPDKIAEETRDFLDFINFKQLRKDIAKNCFIYGDAWCELVYKSGKLIGVVNLNPRQIDYLKTSQGLIKLDRFGNPVGYIQKISYEQAVEPSIANKIQTIGGESGVVLSSEQIARFYFDAVGDGWYGVGLIEPIYYVTLGKNDAETGLAHVVNKVGFPVIINYVGDSSHEPTPEMIEKGAELIKDLNYKTELSVPYYMKIDSLKVTRIEKLKEFLDYFINQQVTGLGLPAPVATGVGDATNRSTLVTQIKLFMRVNEARREHFANQFAKNVLVKLADSRGWDIVPKLVPVKSDIDSLLEGLQKDIKSEKVGDIG